MPSPANSTPIIDAALAERAASLVNPASGLANDYLNVFNEIVMMIDLLPAMPDLADNIEAWSPITYRAYFTRSSLAGSESALNTYDRLDPTFRRAFERCAADLSRAARAACSSILDLTAKADADDALAATCDSQARRLRAKLERITGMVNGDHAPLATRAA